MNCDLSAITHRIGIQLRKRRSALVQEMDLQDVIASALEEAGLTHTREVRLGVGERLDFLLSESAVAIEVKKDKAGMDVWRQVTRYLEHEQVAGCIVIAPRIEPIGTATLSGKPVWAIEFWRYLL